MTVTLNYLELNVIELFCGRGTFTQVFHNAGFNTWKTDIRQRKGVCQPNLKMDILKLPRTLIPFKKCHVLFAAIPCTPFSNASGGHYYEGRTPKENAAPFLKILDRSLKLIEEINPDFFFIENPRAKLRYEKSMVDFLARNTAVIKEITLGSYGFPTTKPTDIFTNAIDWNPRPKLPFGRGYKNNGHLFNNMTQCSRQSTPIEFAQDILQYIQKKVSNPHGY